MPILLSISIGPDIAVDHVVVVVGRHPHCDARLDSPRVSRRHCVLTRAGSEVLVRDLGSTNGTWINGRRVACGRLTPGDELSIAQFCYRLEATPACHATNAEIHCGAKRGDTADYHSGGARRREDYVVSGYPPRGSEPAP
jgi:predicted component of type VI protein secretion system